MVKPYTFEDVISGLNEVAPYDWKKLITFEYRGNRARSSSSRHRGQWMKLTYTENKENFFDIIEDGRANLSGSLGALISKDGVVGDIVRAKPPTGQDWPQA